MKKVREMNGIEKIAYRNIKEGFNAEIGMLYNEILDGYAESVPDTMEEAKQYVYDSVMENWYAQGIIKSGQAPKEMRFAGSDFIIECLDYLFAHDEDVEEIAAEKNW